jgi:hypothetical protein
VWPSAERSSHSHHLIYIAEPDQDTWFWRDASSAAAGHNRALAESKCDWVICVHEDVYLPQGWISRFLTCISDAEAALGKIDVAGVYGIEAGQRVGHVLDRTRLLKEPVPMPCLVNSVDEIIVAVRPGSGLRFDPALGWHLYGTDICLSAQKQGLRVVVVDALCFHNQRSVGVPVAFQNSADYLASKWPEHLPLTTPCMVIPKLSSSS